MAAMVPEAVVRFFLRVTRANVPFVSAAGARRAIRAQALRPESFGPPSRLRAGVRVDVEHHDDAPIYTVTPTRTTPAGNLLYVHGGGWIHEVAPQHWALVAQIAAEASTTVTMPIYALLPVGDARRAHDLVLAAAHRLIERDGTVRLAGDSAGGQIALSVAQTLRDEGVPSVSTVLISPALDLSFTNPRIPEVAPSDPWLGQDGGRELGRHWAGALAIDDPIVSPLAGRFDGLGPMLVFSGTRDVLNPDTRILVREARRAGVDVELDERAGAIHVFPLLPTAHGRDARARIVAFLR